MNGSGATRPHDDLLRTLTGAGPLSVHELASRSGRDRAVVVAWLAEQVRAGAVVRHFRSDTFELRKERP